MPVNISIEEFKHDLGNLSDPSVHILYGLIHDDKDNRLSAFKKIQIIADAYSLKLNKEIETESDAQSSSVQSYKDLSRGETNASAAPATGESHLNNNVATVRPICSKVSVADEIDLKSALRELIGSRVTAHRAGLLAPVPQPAPTLLAQGFDLARCEATADNCETDKVDAAAVLSSNCQQNERNRSNQAPQALRPITDATSSGPLRDDRPESGQSVSVCLSRNPVASSNSRGSSMATNSKTSVAAAANAIELLLRGLLVTENTMFGKMKYHFPFTIRDTLDVSDDGDDVFFDYLEMTDGNMDPFDAVCKELDRQLTCSELKAFLFGKTFAKYKTDDDPDLHGALSKRAIAKYVPLGYSQISCLSIFDGDRRLKRAMELEARLVERYRNVDRRCKNSAQKQEESLKQFPEHVYLVVVAMAFYN